MDAEMLRKRFIATHIINHWQKAGVLTGGQCSAPRRCAAVEAITFRRSHPQPHKAPPASRL